MKVPRWAVSLPCCGIVCRLQSRQPQAQPGALACTECGTGLRVARLEGNKATTHAGLPLPCPRPCFPGWKGLGPGHTAH